MSVPGLRTSDGVNINEIYYDVIIPMIEMYNKEDVTDFRAMFCQDADERVRNYYLPEASRFQLLEDDFEQPDWRKHNKGKAQNFANKYGGGFRYTEAYLKDTSSADIVHFTNALLEEDRLTQRYQILRALMFSGATATNALYNGNFATYEGISAPPAYGANTFTASHNHYIGNQSGTLLLSDITAAKKHIVEHGKQGRIVALVNSEQVQEVCNLASFVTFTGNGEGVSSKISNPLTDRIMTDGYLGRILGVDFVENECIPANYMLMGIFDENELGKPCWFVEPNDPSWRGLQIVPGVVRPDYPLIGATATRWFKIAVKNRGSAYVTCMAADALYANSSYFTSAN